MADAQMYALRKIILDQKVIPAQSVFSVDVGRANELQNIGAARPASAADTPAPSAAAVTAAASASSASSSTAPQSGAKSDPNSLPSGGASA